MGSDLLGSIAFAGDSNEKKNPLLGEIRREREGSVSSDIKALYVYIYLSIKKTRMILKTWVVIF